MHTGNVLTANPETNVCFKKIHINSQKYLFGLRIESGTFA